MLLLTFAETATTSPIEHPITITAIVGSLITVIGVLWKLNQNSVRKIEERWEQCEETHKESQEKLIDLAGEMNFLKGQMDGHKQARADLQAIDGMMKDVLLEVHSALKKRGQKDDDTGN